jgi:ATP-dependent Lon protease
MPPQAAEYSVSRTYLDWLVELPWSVRTEDNLDIAEASRVLDEDHYGLEKAKKRILEYLAVKKLKKDMKGFILCFSGPPGTGKTSLGKSIARALGRKFVRLSLGGVRDESEIRGHRRTYVGALPGRIIQGLRKAESNNPVFMLDEVDKMGASFQGDPSAALLEVLDPEQNRTFSDHYLEVDFDLSRVMFITTANQLDPIPQALRDRMEVLTLSGYTEKEKLEIAKRFIVPRQLEEHGLDSSHLQFEDDSIIKIIRDYTREAGLRNLEREIATICRGVAREIAEGKKEPVHLTLDTPSRFLGPVQFFSEVAERITEPGIATGVAWTPAGGEILFVEAARMKGKKTLTLTGQLGDVMQESAQTALSYVRSRAKELEIPEDFFETSDIHLHVPAGATPKDGPSAGVTMFTALTSLLTKRLVRSDVAMTGEISLRGLVLPVGGIKEKVLAAKRAGISTLILPKKNEKDLDDIPKEIKKKMDFCLVEKMDEVIKIALIDGMKT